MIFQDIRHYQKQHKQYYFTEKPYAAADDLQHDKPHNKLNL